jgi:hypothetical protein
MDLLPLLIGSKTNGSTIYKAKKQWYYDLRVWNVVRSYIYPPRLRVVKSIQNTLPCEITAIDANENGIYAVCDFSYRVSGNTSNRLVLINDTGIHQIGIFYAFMSKITNVLLAPDGGLIVYGENTIGKVNLNSVLDSTSLTGLNTKTVKIDMTPTGLPCDKGVILTLLELEWSKIITNIKCVTLSQHNGWCIMVTTNTSLFYFGLDGEYITSNHNTLFHPIAMSYYNNHLYPLERDDEYSGGSSGGSNTLEYKRVFYGKDGKIVYTHTRVIEYTPLTGDDDSGLLICVSKDLVFLANKYTDTISYHYECNDRKCGHYESEMRCVKMITRGVGNTIVVSDGNYVEVLGF